MHGTAADGRSGLQAPGAHSADWAFPAILPGHPQIYAGSAAVACWHYVPDSTDTGRYLWHCGAPSIGAEADI